MISPFASLITFEDGLVTDESDENYYNAIDDNKFNKISEIGSNKFFRKSCL